MASIINDPEVFCDWCGAPVYEFETSLTMERLDERNPLHTHHEHLPKISVCKDCADGLDEFINGKKTMMNNPGHYNPSTKVKQPKGDNHARDLKLTLEFPGEVATEEQARATQESVLQWRGDKAKGI